MDKSKVFFTNLHTTPSSNLLDKMERLIKRAGIESIDFKDQFVAIKIHFGEPGNLAYLRPNYCSSTGNPTPLLGSKTLSYRLQHALLWPTCQRGRPFTKRHGKWI